MKHVRLAALILCATFVANAPAFAQETISGSVVSLTTGSPLAGIDMDVFDSAGASVTITGGFTDAAGSYTLVVPGPGTYRVRADPRAADGVASQFYGGSLLKSLATPLVIGPGAALSGIDFSLPAGFDVSGLVSSGGTPLADIDIDVYASNGEFLSAYPGITMLDGSYSVGALAPGSYFVRADPDATLAGQMYVDAYFGGSPDLATATPVVVTSANLGTVDIALTPGGTIAGTATDLLTGLALPGLDLDLFDLIGQRVKVPGATAADGSYEVGAVPAGSYLLRVDPTLAQAYARTYYTTSATEAGATPITVVAGVRTSGTNFAIDIGGTLSGVVRDSASSLPLPGIDIDMFDSLGKLTPSYTAKTDVSGFYQLGPMQPGTYFVKADPSVAQGYAEQFYAGQIDIGTATAVNVAAGADTGNVDFNLVSAGAIRGLVRNQVLAPLAGIDMDLYDSAGTRLRKGATTALDGSFAFESLAAGTYKVRADPTALQGYAQLYYIASTTRPQATLVQAVGGAPTTGVDFTLPVAATLSGMVTDDTGALLAGTDIDVLEVQGSSFTQLDQGAITDLSGAYLVEALPPGDYIVRADPIVVPHVYHGGTTDPTQAIVLSLSAGQNITNVDISVAVSGSTTTTTFAPAGICADATGDGLVTATDALVALNVVVGFATCDLCLCDTDSSGAVVATDALMILSAATGLSVTLACPACGP